MVLLRSILLAHPTMVSLYLALRLVRTHRMTLETKVNCDMKMRRMHLLHRIVAR